MTSALAQALVRHNTMVIGPTRNQLAIGLMCLCVKVLRHVQVGMPDEEIERRVDLQEAMSILNKRGPK